MKTGGCTMLDERCPEEVRKPTSVGSEVEIFLSGRGQKGEALALVAVRMAKKTLRRFMMGDESNW